MAQPWFGPVVSAIVFALFHGAQNAALFVDRLALGLIAGFLVWRTGGLEAAIAAHVVSNVLTYVLAGVTTSVATVRAVEEISWVDAVIDVAGLRCGRGRGGAGRASDVAAQRGRSGFYSTVTDFARLRGWSTSWPLAIAISEANTCSGTVATSGCSSVGVGGMGISSSA